MKKAALFFLSHLLLCGSAFPISRGESGADFLKLPNGVRAVAMGSSFTAVADDVSSVFWNPAGIALLEAPELAFSYVKLFDRVDGVSQVSAAVEIPRFPFENVNSCVGFLSISTGSFDSTDPDALIRTPSGSASDAMMFCSMGAQVGDLLTSGISLKLVRRGLSGADSSSYVQDPVTGDFIPTRAVDYQAYGVGFDIGAIWTSPDGVLSYGASMLNLGAIGPFKEGASLSFWKDSEPLPARVRLGGAYRSVLFGQSLLTSLDLHSLLEAVDKPKLAAGVEYGISEIAFLRLGWDQPLDEPIGRTALDFGDSSGLASLPSPLRTGIGIRWRTSPSSLVQFDYALAPFGTLGTVHHAAMLLRWNIPKPPPLISTAAPEIEKRAKQGLTIEPKKIGIAESVKEWRVEITDEGGRVVKTFAGKGMPPKSLQWDGTDERGNLLTDVSGLKFVLKAKDLNDRTVRAASAISAVRAESRFKAVAGRLLYPELRFIMPKENLKSWELAVEDSGETVRKWQGTGKPQGIISWNGRDASGNPVTLKSPEYSWRFTGADGQVTSGNKSIVQVEADIKSHMMENSVRMVGIRFMGRSAEIRRDHLAVIEKAAQFVSEHPRTSVVIESYSDFRGSDAENHAVARERAERVLRTAVESYGLEASSVTLRVFGRSRKAPEYRGIPSDEGRDRVDIVVRTRK